MESEKYNNPQESEDNKQEERGESLIESICEEYSDKLGVPSEKMRDFITYGLIDSPHLFRPDLHVKNLNLDITPEELVDGIKEARSAIKERAKEQGLA